MKTIKQLALIAIAGTLLAGPVASFAADEKKAEKPYTLEKCIVSDEKLGEMGKPFVFDYKGQEIKLCCKNCKKDFDKDPAKYMKKLEEANAGKKTPAADGHEAHTH